VSYYANSVAHLLGPFMTAVRARDILPIESALALPQEHFPATTIMKVT